MRWLVMVGCFEKFERYKKQRLHIWGRRIVTAKNDRIRRLHRLGRTKQRIESLDNLDLIT